MNVCVQLFISDNVTVFPVDTSFAFKLILTLSGLFPSWLSLSFHTFVTGISIVSGVCVFVTIYPSVALPVTSAI